jgi:hypothetical protein
MEHKLACRKYVTPHFREHAVQVGAEWCHQTIQIAQQLNYKLRVGLPRRIFRDDTELKTFKLKIFIEL